MTLNFTHLGKDVQQYMPKMVRYDKMDFTIGFPAPENPRIEKISEFYRLVFHLGKDV